MSDKLDKYKVNLGDNIFGESLSILPQILLDNNALVSGSSLLAAVNGTSFDDIDIYVNLKRAQNLYVDLLAVNARPIDGYSYTPPPYAKSYMMKNKILGRVQMMSSEQIRLDIKVVDDENEVVNIPKSSDLSICANWYDGEHLWSLHPEDVLAKAGYFKSFMGRAPDRYDIERIEKYREKGYNIISSSEEEMDNDPIIQELWVSFMVVEYLAHNMSNTQKYSPMILILKLLNDTENHMYKWVNVLSVFRDLYILKIEEQPSGGIYNTINDLMAVIICTSNNDVCQSPLYKKYVEGVTGIVLTGPKSHSVDSTTYIPMCGGTVPPFSAGYNDIPAHYTNEDLMDVISDVQNFMIFTQSELNIFFTQNYPRLAYTMHQKRQRDLQIKLALEAENAEPQERLEKTYILEDPHRVINGTCLSINGAEKINTKNWYPQPGHILFLMDFSPEGSTEPEENSTIVCTSIDIIMESMKSESNSMYKCSTASGYGIIPKQHSPNQTETTVFLSDLDSLQINSCVGDDGCEGSSKDDCSMDKCAWYTGAIDLIPSEVVLDTTYIMFSYPSPDDHDLPITGYLPESQMRRIINMTRDGGATSIFTIRFVDTIPWTISKRNTVNGTEDANYVSENHCQHGSTIQIFTVKEFGDDRSRSPPPAPVAKRVRRPRGGAHRALSFDSPSPDLERSGGIFDNAPIRGGGGMGLF